MQFWYIPTIRLLVLAAMYRERAEERQQFLGITYSQLIFQVQVTTVQQDLEFGTTVRIYCDLEMGNHRRSEKSL